jgi:hypothetical protein
MIFYAGINVGFGPSSKSQINEQILQDACFNLLSNLKNSNLPINAKATLKQSSVHTDKEKELRLPNYSALPDSPDVKNNHLQITSPDTTVGGNDKDSTKLLNAKNLTKKDSLKTKINQDSLRLVQMSLDSTARLKYFHYEREDLPYTTLKQKRLSKFFVEPSPNLKTRKVTIDSTGKFVEIQDLIAGKLDKIILRLP